MAEITFELILQAISTLAVVATIIYLAIQIRQSNALQQSTILMESTNNFNNFAMSIAQDQELSDLFFKSIGNLEKLDIDEQRRGVLLITSMIRMFENVYLQNEKNSFHSKAWQGYSQQAIRLTNYPGALAFMKARQSWFEPSFVEYIHNNRPPETESENANMKS